MFIRQLFGIHTWKDHEQYFNLLLGLGSSRLVIFMLLNSWGFSSITRSREKINFSAPTQRDFWPLIFFKGPTNCIISFKRTFGIVVDLLWLSRKSFEIFIRKLIPRSTFIAGPMIRKVLSVLLSTYYCSSLLFLVGPGECMSALHFTLPNGT